MDAILITNKGIEPAAQQEIQEILGVPAKIEETVLEFSPKSPEDLCKLCYVSQSANRIVWLLKRQLIQDVDEITLDMDLAAFVKGAKSFFIECVRVGQHGFHSVDVEKKISSIVAGAYNLAFTKENPDIAFFAYLYNDHLYFGIDIAGFDLSKRSYKIFNVPNSLKGPVGYAVVRESGYQPGDKLVITSSKDGVLPIEAVCFGSGYSVHHFIKQKFIFHKYHFIRLPKDFLETLDAEAKPLEIFALDPSNHNLTLTKKNAKVAGVEKLLHFSRLDLEWLDTKFDEGSVDTIIGHLPAVSKHREEQNVKKIYREFFNQASFLIKQSGTILTLTLKTDLLEEAAKEYKLSVKKEKSITQGQGMFCVMIFGK